MAIERPDGVLSASAHPGSPRPGWDAAPAYVYCHDIDGSVHILFWNGTQWLDQQLGVSFAAGAGPSAYAGSNGYFYVYYPGSDGAMHIMLWNGAQWQDQTLGGTVAAGSSPSAF